MATDIIARISAARFAALKAGDGTTATKLGTLLGNANGRAKDGKSAPREVDDNDVIAAIRDTMKKASETAAAFTKLGRIEEAAKSTEEVTLVASFLPQGPTTEALTAAIDAILAEMPGAGMKQMGEVMTKLSAQFGTGLDRSVASPLIKARLSAG